MISLGAATTARENNKKTTLKMGGGWINQKYKNT